MELFFAILAADPNDDLQTAVILFSKKKTKKKTHFSTATTNELSLDSRHLISNVWSTYMYITDHRITVVEKFRETKATYSFRHVVIKSEICTIDQRRTFVGISFNNDECSSHLLPRIVLKSGNYFEKVLFIISLMQCIR